MNRPRLALVALLVCVLGASGCGPFLSAQSLPPPGRTAAFDADDDHLTLSQGVAIVLSCYHGGPCRDVVVSTADASIADVKSASIGANALAAGAAGAAEPRYSTATTAGFVVVGKHPGTTKVKVKTSKGTKTIRVDVVPPPSVGTPAIVAR